MAVRIDIAPEVLRWAIHRTGIPLEHLEKITHFTRGWTGLYVQRYLRPKSSPIALAFPSATYCPMSRSSSHPTCLTSAR